MSESKNAERALTPGLIMSQKMRIRKTRELPVRGEILVHTGQWVDGATRVAQAFLPGELFIMRIAERLGIEPFEAVKGLKVKEGDSVSEGMLLCEHAGLFGLFKNRFVSPLSGTVEFIAERTGHIGVRVAPTPIHVDAYIAGTVVSTEPEKAVTIECEAAYVQGIFGVGGERQGALHLLAVSGDEVLTPAHFSSDVRGRILVGGTKPSVAALHAACEAGALGLVVGSIDDRALAAYLGYDLGIALTGDEKISMTVVVTEGFGAIAMSDRVLEVLRPFHGQAACLNGATQVRAGALRPEIISGFQALSAQDNSRARATNSLCVGSSIRIIRVPYFGERGVVVGLPAEAQRIETGAMARVLEAKLDDGRVVMVPRANVELV